MKQKSLKTLIVVVSLSFIFILSQTSLVSAFSVRELLGLEKPEQEQNYDIQKKQLSENENGEKSSKEWAKTSKEAASTNPQLDLDYFTLLVNNMNVQEREQLLSDDKLFQATC